MRLIIFILAISFTVIPNTLCDKRCESDNDCLGNYMCIEGECIHKDVFPLNYMEIFILILMCLISTVATTAGVGGGAIYSAILLLVENFTTKEAFPISNLIILFCSLTTFYVEVKNKYKDPSPVNKFIDYNMVVVFCPTLLLGTKLGVIMNKVLPSLVLIILLILSSSSSSFKAYKNAVKQKKMEEKDKRVRTLKHKYSIEDIYISDEEEDFYDAHTAENIGSLRERLLPCPEEEDLLGKNYHFELSNKGNDNAKDREDNRTMKIDAENDPLRMDRIKYILFLGVIMIIDQLIEGNNKFPSLFGIKKCSTVFWIAFILFALFCVWFAKYSYHNVKEEEHKKTIYRKFNNSLSEKEFDITSKESEGKINKIILSCLFAGIISGMLGVGGGMIMAPLMLELGVHPKTAAATSNFLLLFTSSAATILFLLSDQLIYSYALTFAIPCGICSLVGSTYIHDYIARTNKNSVLIFCLFYVMILSLIILPINGITRAIYDYDNGVDILALKNYCN